MNSFALFAVTLTIPDFWTPVVDWAKNLGPMGILAPYLITTWTYGLRRARRRLAGDPSRGIPGQAERYNAASADWDDRLGIIVKFLATTFLAPLWVPTSLAGKGVWKALTVGTGIRK